MIDKEEANRLRRMVNVWNCFHEECVLCVFLLSPWSIHSPYFSNLLHALRGYGFVISQFPNSLAFRWFQPMGARRVCDIRSTRSFSAWPWAASGRVPLLRAKTTVARPSLMATSLGGFLLPFTLRGNSSFPSDADPRALSHPCFPVTLLTPGQIVFSLNSPRIGVCHLFPLWDSNWCRMQEEAEWRQVKYCLRHIV